MVEAAKDRWNDEIENAVRWVQRTDWNEVREGMEGAVSRLLGGGLQKSREGIEEAENQVVPRVLEAVNERKAAARKGVDQIGAQTTEYRAAAKAKADSLAESVKSSPGTVDAARGAVRDVISKGLEKGKEAIGKAQEAIGRTTEKLESEVQSKAHGLSAVEKALHERYEKPDGLNKSVAEVLEERYKPIDSRDNTVLRGV